MPCSCLEINTLSIETECRRQCQGVLIGAGSASIPIESGHTLHAPAPLQPCQATASRKPTWCGGTSSVVCGQRVDVVAVWPPLHVRTSSQPASVQCCAGGIEAGVCFRQGREATQVATDRASAALQLSHDACVPVPWSLRRALQADRPPLRTWLCIRHRKVAVPVPDGASWESFCRTVQQKLKLLGIDSIYLASVITEHACVDL